MAVLWIYRRLLHVVMRLLLPFRLIRVHRCACALLRPPRREVLGPCVLLPSPLIAGCDLGSLLILVNVFVSAIESLEFIVGHINLVIHLYLTRDVAATRRL